MGGRRVRSDKCESRLAAGSPLDFSWTNVVESAFNWRLAAAEKETNLIMEMLQKPNVGWRTF
jgi:hypothetical protein